ncbi:MAG: hypothetical protein AABY64_13530 [Bdellovibrionota bacterium]
MKKIATIFFIIISKSFFIPTYVNAECVVTKNTKLRKTHNIRNEEIKAGSSVVMMDGSSIEINGLLEDEMLYFKQTDGKISF